MIRRLLATTAAAGALVLGTGTAAQAIPNPFVGDCKTAPSAQMPGSGITGWFEPTQPDGVAATSSSPLFEQYGYAGMQWDTYDLGCGPDAARDPAAVGGTSVGNWAFIVPQFMLSATASIDRVAFHPTWLGVFDPLITRLVSTLQTNLFAKWVAVPFVLIGLSVMWKARKGQASSAATMFGAALFVMVIAAAVFQFPTEIGHQTDRVMTAGVSAVSNVSNSKSNDPSLTMEDSVYADVIYPMWLSGELGSSTSPTAMKYGPQLLAATAFTWEEAKTCQAAAPVSLGPFTVNACSAVAAEKADQFKKVAQQIHDTDPSAYAHLTGHDSTGRVSAGMLATVAVAILMPFLLMSGLLVIAAYAIIRIAVMLSAAIALVALRIPKAGVAALSSVAAAVVNAIAFALGATVMIDVIGVTLAPSTGLPTWLGLVLAALFGLVGWKMLKPMRKLTTMVSGSNMVADASGALPKSARNVVASTWGLAKSAGAAYLGGRVAGHAAADEIAEEAEAKDARSETADVASPKRAATSPAAVLASAAATTRVDRDDAPAASTGLPPLPQPPDGPPPVGAGTGQPLPSTEVVVAGPQEPGPPDLPKPIFPATDGQYEVYRPGEAPTAPEAAQSDDGSYKIWQPE